MFFLLANIVDNLHAFKNLAKDNLPWLKVRLKIFIIDKELAWRLSNQLVTTVQMNLRKSQNSVQLSEMTLTNWEPKKMVFNVNE